MITSCPISNLPVEERPEWTDLHVNPSYKVTFKKIGNDILLHVAEGKMEHFDCDRYFEIREKVIGEAFDNGQKFVDIKSYEQLTGSPPFAERKKLLVKMSMEEYRCKGYIVFGLSPFTSLIFRTGVRTLVKIPFPVHTPREYASAINLAIDISNKHIAENDTINISEFTKRDKWKFTSSDKECSIEFRVGAGNILFSSYSGKLNEEGLAFLKSTMENIFSDGLITGGFYRISDFSKSISIHYTIRKSYIDFLNTMRQKYKVYPMKSYIYGAKRIFRIFLLFGEPLIKTNMTFVKNFDEAVKLIRDPSKKQKKSRKVSIVHSDIDKLTIMISTIAWDIDNNNNLSLDPNSPLKQIEEALDIVKKDRADFIQELQEKNQNLEKVNSELAEARDLAQIANYAKGRFLANMSHELRTPLNGVIGMAEILESTELTEEQKSYLSIIATSSNHLLSVINDILDFSKIESGQILLEQISFDLTSVIHETVTILSPKALEKNIPIKANISTKIAHAVIGDPFRLRQVILNILQNAVKFTSQGEIVVAVSILSETEFEQKVHFEISDTGIGIEPEIISKLFSQFVQADPSTTRKYGGTGLGLVISKQLLTLMGGTIQVESTPGKGSTFSFVIPFKKAAVELAPKSRLINLSNIDNTDNRLKKYESPVIFNDKRSSTSPDFSILLAEDVPTNQYVIRKMLEKIGFVNLTICQNGIEALSTLKTKKFDLIFMDCQMPELDGFETTRVIRNKESDILDHESIIIAFTAHAMEEEIRKCYDCGMNDYVLKPLTMDSLKAVLKKWIKTSLPF